MTEAKIKGTVKWFSNRKGFGFITPTSDSSPTTEDIFVHQSNIVTEAEYRTLKDGFEVEFEVITDENGKLKAQNVTSADGTPCPGPEPRERRKRPKKKKDGNNAGGDSGEDDDDYEDDGQEDDDGEDDGDEEDGEGEVPAVVEVANDGGAGGDDKKNKGNRRRGRNNKKKNDSDQGKEPNQQEGAKGPKGRGGKQQQAKDGNKPNNNKQNNKQNPKQGQENKQPQPKATWFTELEESVQKSMESRGIKLDQSGRAFVTIGDARIKVGTGGYLALAHAGGILAEGTFATDKAGKVTATWKYVLKYSTEESEWKTSTPDDEKDFLVADFLWTDESVLPTGTDETVEKLWGEGVADPKDVLEKSGFQMRKMALHGGTGGGGNRRHHHHHHRGRGHRRPNHNNKNNNNNAQNGGNNNKKGGSGGDGKKQDAGEAPASEDME